VDHDRPTTVRDGGAPLAGAGRPGRDRAAQWWFAVIALVVGAALVTQVGLLVSGGADANSGRAGEGAPVGTRLVRLVGYFTIQSNLLVLATSALLAVRPRRGTPLWRTVRLDALLGIIITGLVFATVLAPRLHLTGAALWCTIAFHYFAPVATVLGLLLVEARPGFRVRDVAWGLVWPLAWIGYTLARGAATGWYPYPFLDVGRLGYGAALRNIGVVVVIALVVMGVLYALGRERRA
jgi:hypothetical protein